VVLHHLSIYKTYRNTTKCWCSVFFICHNVYVLLVQNRTNLGGVHVSKHVRCMLKKQQLYVLNLIFVLHLTEGKNETTMIDGNGLGKLLRGRGGEVGILLIEGVDKIDVILLI